MICKHFLIVPFMNNSSKMAPNRTIINFLDTKAKCRHCGRCLSEFIAHVGIFDPAFWTVAHVTFSLVQLSPLPLTRCQQCSIYRQFVAGRGWGLLSPVGANILQEFNTLYLTRFRTYKIARPPITKTWRGGGLRQVTTCRKVSLQVNFFRWRHFALVSVKLISVLAPNSSPSLFLLKRKTMTTLQRKTMTTFHMYCRSILFVYTGSGGR